MTMIPTYPDDAIEPTLYSYQRPDGSWVCHVDTYGLPENRRGPKITVYINDDCDDPVFDNQ
jgi:hypothetical protein